MGLYTTLTKAGVATVEAEYYGGGDEGYIETLTMFDIKGEQVENKEAQEIAERFVYDKLPGGFEINEGSQGSVKIDVIERKAYFDHHENEVVSHHRPYEVDGD